MSEECTTPDLVEITRGMFEAAQRRDVEFGLSFYAPEAVWDMSPMGLGTYEGRAAIVEFWEDFYDNFEEHDFELQEVLDLGNGVIFAVARQDARPVGSPGHVHRRDGWVYIWVDGMVARVTLYADADEGRAAAERLAESKG